MVFPHISLIENGTYHHVQLLSRSILQGLFSLQLIMTFEPSCKGFEFPLYGWYQAQMDLEVPSSRKFPRSRIYFLSRTLGLVLFLQWYSKSVLFSISLFPKAWLRTLVVLGYLPASLAFTGVLSMSWCKLQYPELWLLPSFEPTSHHYISHSRGAVICRASVVTYVSTQFLSLYWLYLSLLFILHCNRPCFILISMMMKSSWTPRI